MKRLTALSNGRKKKGEVKKMPWDEMMGGEGKAKCHRAKKRIKKKIIDRERRGRRGIVLGRREHPGKRVS